MPTTPQPRPADSGARQRRSGLTMTWVPRRDAQGRTHMEAHWVSADAVSASRSAA